MAEIKHLLHIGVFREQVYKAISTIDGLSSWWTSQTSGTCEPGGVIEFRFGPRFSNKMKVIDMSPGQHVTWECIEGATDWIGTKVTIRLDENEGKTRVKFIHSGFKETDDFFAQCNFSWGRYMESLRSLCEKGKGMPFSAN